MPSLLRQLVSRSDRILCDVHTHLSYACRFLSHPFRQPEHMYYNHGTHAWVRACILAANITSIESFVYHSHRALNFFAFSFHWNVFSSFFASDLSARMTQHAYAHFLLVFLFLLCVIKDTILLFIKYLVTMSTKPKALSLSCSPLCGWVALNASQWAQRVAKWIENLSTFCARSGKFVCEHEWIRLSTLQTERVGWGRVRERNRDSKTNAIKSQINNSWICRMRIALTQSNEIIIARHLGVIRMN